MRRITRENYIDGAQDARKEVLPLVDWVSDDILLIHSLQSIRKPLNENKSFGINMFNVVDLFTKEPFLAVYARQNGYGFDYLISVEKGFSRLSGELKFLASVAVSKAILTDKNFTNVGFRCNKRVNESAHVAARSFFRRLVVPDNVFLSELQNFKKLFVQENRPFNERHFGQHIGHYLSSFPEVDSD